VRPEDTSIIHYTNTLPVYYKPETTFRIVGNEKYDKIIQKYTLRKFYEIFMIPIGVGGILYWKENISNAFFENLVSFPLGKTLLEHFGQEFITHLSYGGISAIFLLSSFKYFTLIDRKYVSGIFITNHGDCTVKFYERKGTDKKYF
jgi:hypothetical protein